MQIRLQTRDPSNLEILGNMKKTVLEPNCELQVRLHNLEKVQFVHLLISNREVVHNNLFIVLE